MMNLDSQVRIAGQGGAGLFIEPIRLPASEAGGPLQSGVDIALLSPDRCVTYLARQMLPGFMHRLADFLRVAANAEEGSEALGPLEDRLGGVRIDIAPLDGMWVEIEISIAENPGDDLVEFDGLNFETSRASLLVAAQTAELVRGIRDESRG